MKILNRFFSLKGSKTGLTLVELLVAVVVIGVGCLAVMTVHISSLKSKKLADNMNLAKTIAVTEMERLKTLPFDVVKSSTNTEVDKLNHLGQPCPADADCSGYVFKRKVRFFPKKPTSLSCQVEIEVEWADSVNRRSLLYTSVLTSTSFS
jgi:prepilin-type N-terminal cleavage/methylation domain-containing protein